jgi:hypothetical protein
VSEEFVSFTLINCCVSSSFCSSCILWWSCVDVSLSRAGSFCNAVIRDILGIDPNGQTPSVATKTLASTALCNGCFLSSLAQVLQMPMASATEYATALSSLQSSCKTTVAVASTPSKTSWAISCVLVLRSTTLWKYH